jgi:hypothetical protein
MANDPESKKNVVNLAEARKRQRTVRAGASSRSKDGAGKRKGGRRVWVYLQFLLFLAVVAYMMQLCQSRSGG